MFPNLTIKSLKPLLTKAKSGSHLEGLLSGITISEILKKKLNHFCCLNLHWNWNCFLLAMKLYTFNIFQLWVCNILLMKRVCWQNHNGFLRDLPRFPFQKPIWILLFTIRKSIYAVHLYVFVIYAGYIRKICDMISMIFMITKDYREN